MVITAVTGVLNCFFFFSFFFWCSVRTKETASSDRVYQTLKKVYFAHNSIVCLHAMLLLLHTKPEKLNLQ